MQSTCPHCTSTNLFSASVQADGSAGSLLPVGALHGARYDNVVCGNCGYTQWFVSQQHLHLVREKLKPLS